MAADESDERGATDADAGGSATTGPEVPRPLRTACLILAAEALALLGIAGFLLYRTAFGHPDNVSRALLDALMAFAGAVVLALGARGLLRLNPSARTPIVVIQVLAVPVGYSLGFQAGRVAYGGPILVAALAVIYLLFTPPARLVLDRRIDRDV